MASFVGAAVRSVLADTYPAKEIIVVDDGSRDGSGDAAEQCSRDIRVIRQQNQGAANALNNGFAASRGEYFCWLSADDLFVAGKLEAQLAVLARHPDAAATHTDAEVINATGGHLRYAIGGDYCGKTALYRLLLGNDINGSTVMIRRQAFEDMGRFDTRFRADVDGAMWMKMLANSLGIVRTPGVFGKYRWHAGNQSHDTKLMSDSMDATRLEILSEYWPKVQWWEGAGKSWSQALALGLDLQGCPQSAKFVEERMPRPFSGHYSMIRNGARNWPGFLGRAVASFGRRHLRRVRDAAQAAE